VKRTDLVRHLGRYDGYPLREGARHSVFANRLSGKVATVPRHREINEFLARKICRDLEVVEP